MAVIETSGLTKRYRKTLAVDRISFQVEQGQIFGFLGPNGAGKTSRSLRLDMDPPAQHSAEPRYQQRGDA